VPLLLTLITACAGSGMRATSVSGGALRISEIAGSGDHLRRASTRVILEGLAAGSPERALTHYQRAIQLDATNPYAYLVLASHEIQWGDPERGEQSLRQAELLLQSEELDSPRVSPHLVGLRGRARIRSAGDESGGKSLLKDARRLAPNVWGDGWLSAAELR
jgi:hypothetical protein